MDEIDRSALEDRLLGVKVCLQDIMEVVGDEDEYAVFDAALDLALAIEGRLRDSHPARD